MYQPVNYANDFLQGMKGVQDIQSQAKQDDRRDKEMAMLTERAGMEVKKHQLDIDAAERDVAERDVREADVKALEGLKAKYGNDDPRTDQGRASILNKLKAVDTIGKITDDAKVLKLSLEDPNNPYGNPIQATPAPLPGTGAPGPAIPSAPTSGLAQNADVSQAPPAPAPQVDAAGIKHWRITQANFPDKFAAFDAATRTAYPGRFDKIHTDEQTGVRYKLYAPNAINLASDNTISTDYQVINVDTGEVIPNMVVPITANGTSKGDDPVKRVNIDDYQKSLQMQMQMYQTALDRGISTHEALDLLAPAKLPYKQQLELDKKQAELGMTTDAHLKQKKGEIDLTSAEKAKTDAKVKAEAEKVQPLLEKIAANKDLSQEQKRAAAAPILAGLSGDAAKHLQGLKGVSRELFPEAKAETPHTQKVDVGNGKEQTFQYNPATQRYDIPVGKPGAKFSPTSSGGANGDTSLTKLDKERLAVIKQEYDRKSKTRDTYLKMSETAFGPAKEEIKARITALDAELAGLERKQNDFFSPAADRPKSKNSLVTLGMNGSYVSPGEADTSAPYRVANNKPAGAVTAKTKGNAVVFNGKSYTPDANGIVTVDGKKYKVQKN